jgi:hypothetical protein
MSEPYLILHKVRGEPAFDIAIQIEIGDEQGWIIPTSGHRAYPYRSWAIQDLYDGSDMDMPKPEYVMDTIDPPEGLPDHYTINPTREPLTSRVSSLLTTLGLKGKPIKRRSI